MSRRDELRLVLCGEKKIYTFLMSAVIGGGWLLTHWGAAGKTDFSHADGWQLDVAVDVEAVVFAGQHHGAVVHQGHVEALGVLDLGLQGREELAVLREHAQVEVVVVVCDRHLASSVDSHTDGVVGQTCKNTHTNSKL